MTPAERTAKVAELRAEADRLEREGKRNWPERVEAGQIFKIICLLPCDPACIGDLYIVAAGIGGKLQLVNLRTGTHRDRDSVFGKGEEENFIHLGYARDLLTIKTPDEEPTGAELVGKVCEFSEWG